MSRYAGGTVTPRSFYDEICLPNAQVLLNAPGDIRLCVNFIMTIDAFFGVLHAHLYEQGLIAIARDDDWKETIAETSDPYRLLRDSAYALKHGRLTGSKARVVRRPNQIEGYSGSFDSAVWDRSAFDTDVVWIEAEINPMRADDAVRHVLPIASNLLDRYSL